MQASEKMQASPLKISTCFWMCFISLIPIVGLGYDIVFSSCNHPAKRNLARALLLLRLTVILLGISSFLVIIFSLDLLI